MHRLIMITLKELAPHCFGDSLQQIKLLYTCIISLVKIFCILNHGPSVTAPETARGTPAPQSGCTTVQLV